MNKNLENLLYKWCICSRYPNYQIDIACYDTSLEAIHSFENNNKIINEIRILRLPRFLPLFINNYLVNNSFSLPVLHYWNGTYKEHLERLENIRKD